MASGGFFGACGRCLLFGLRLGLGRSVVVPGVGLVAVAMVAGAVTVAGVPSVAGGALLPVCPLRLWWLLCSLCGLCGGCPSLPVWLFLVSLVGCGSLLAVAVFLGSCCGACLDCPCGLCSSVLWVLGCALFPVPFCHYLPVFPRVFFHILPFIPVKNALFPSRLPRVRARVRAFSPVKMPIFANFRAVFSSRVRVRVKVEPWVGGGSTPAYF